SRCARLPAARRPRGRAGSPAARRASREGPRVTISWVRGRRRGLAAAAGVLLAAGAALWGFQAWRGRGFTEYRMPSATDIPAAVPVAPDGTVWVPIEFSDAIGILRNGRIDKIAKGRANFEPLGLAVDAEGYAWYTDGPPRVVSRVSPAGVITSFPLSGSLAKLGRLAVAPDGAVWFAGGTRRGLTGLEG